MNISQQQMQVGKSNNYIDIKYIQFFIVLYYLPFLISVLKVE